MTDGGSLCIYNNAEINLLIVLPLSRFNVRM